MKTADSATSPRKAKARAIEPLQLQRILAPTDFSRPSRRALRSAITLAEKLGAQVRLLYVINPAELPLPALDLPPLPSDRSETQWARKHLRTWATKFGLSETDLRHGLPYEEIVAAAGELKADLIVLATHGYTGLKRVFLGSTAERVVQHATCPVFVARRPREKTGAIRKILVPVDFSACARAGLEYALRLAKAFRSELLLVHSVNVHVYALSDEYSMHEAPDILARAEEDALEEMEKLQDEIARRGFKVKTRVAAGPPFDQVCVIAQETKADLIVTSTHGRSGLKHALIGSTAEKIVRHADCSVLVVPNRS